MTLPADYTERVYAGVLGKIIGVYLGRPFEGWTYDWIMKELGEINYYVHEKLNVPLVVTDDDIAGTFTFLRALPDHGNSLNLTAEQIGQSWMNYLIEKRTILWWGGMGNSTEHTAYLRLKHGIPAPRSGSIELNGKVVAEQIGAQIFIDGWAMVAPGNPELAADLARRAGSVSHDGEAIYGAQVWAAMEAQAFVEKDLDKLIDVGVSQVPHDSVIYRMIADIRNWRGKYSDWREARECLQAEYGYEKYGGNCHMVPNHGLMHLSLLYGDDSFQKTLMIVNTGGWDTDCNSGNVGCLMGIKNSLAGIDDGPDYRTPVADRMYNAAADGGRVITDAVIETNHIVNIGRALNQQAPLAFKNGARFHFELPGALQGFQPEDSIESRGTLALENVSGHSRAGQRSLALRYQGVAYARPARAATPTFIPLPDPRMRTYDLMASPTLYPGQTVHAGLSTDSANASPVTCRLYVRSYGVDDHMDYHFGPEQVLQPGAYQELTWKITDESIHPVAEIGLEVSSEQRADGVVYLDYLGWDGQPALTFANPQHKGKMWRKAWMNGVDHYDGWYPESFRTIQDEGRGLLMTGTREWKDYTVQADINPHMLTAAGIAGRVQGLLCYYSLEITADRKARLVKMQYEKTILAETDCPFEWDETVLFELAVEGNRLRASLNGKAVFDVVDQKDPLLDGGIALLVEEGRMSCEKVSVK
jgi:ADP-ribosylglycohydrolase